MELKVMGSSSKGNSYALCCNEEILLVEAGIKVQDIIKGIDYQLKKVRGVIFSHQHL